MKRIVRALSRTAIGISFVPILAYPALFYYALWGGIGVVVAWLCLPATPFVFSYLAYANELWFPLAVYWTAWLVVVGACIILDKVD